MNGGGGGDSSQQQPQQHQQHQQQQQQQWMAMHQYQQQLMAMQMQYPASVMMHQNMIYGGQHYMPGYYQQHHMYQQHQQQSQQQHQQQQQSQGKQSHQIPTSSEDNRTIWIGDLQQWMDEAYLQSCFAKAGEVLSVKVIRNKQTGQSERYGFIEFSTHAAADTVLQSINGSPMPNCEQVFRLNWSAFSMGNKRMDEVSDLSIFVGDLAPDVTDTILHETFASRYPSVTGAKVVVDTNTGRSKGYGFVRFGDENEKTRSMTEMNGAYCSSRPMRIGVATPKKPGTQQQQYASQAVILSGGYPSNGSSPQGYQSDGDSSNTTIFVGGLDADVTDDELKQSFIEFGEVVSVKIPPGKGCGFVQFSNRSNAEEAIQSLNGTVIGKQTVRLSWGRNQVNRQLKMDYGNQRNGGGYGRQGGYNGNGQYAYAAAVANGGASSNGYENHQPEAIS